VKISTLNVVTFSIGAILIYSGIKCYNPRDVIVWGLGGKKPSRLDEEWKVKNPQDKPPSAGGPEYPGDVGIPDPSEEGRVDT